MIGFFSGLRVSYINLLIWIIMKREINKTEIALEYISPWKHIDSSRQI